MFGGKWLTGFSPAPLAVRVVVEEEWEEEDLEDENASFDRREQRQCPGAARRITTLVHPCRVSLPCSSPRVVYLYPIESNADSPESPSRGLKQILLNRVVDPWQRLLSASGDVGAILLSVVFDEDQDVVCIYM